MDLIRSMLETEKEAEEIIREAEETAGRIIDTARQDAAERLLKARQEGILAGEACVEAAVAAARQERQVMVEKEAETVQKTLAEAAIKREAALDSFTRTLTN